MCRYHTSATVRLSMCKFVVLRCFQPHCRVGILDEITRVHEQNVRCASVHLVSSMHCKCTIDFFAYTVDKFGGFLYFMLRNAAPLAKKFWSVRLPNSADSNSKKIRRNSVIRFKNCLYYTMSACAHHSTDKKVN